MNVTPAIDSVMVGADGPEPDDDEERERMPKLVPDAGLELRELLGRQPRAQRVGAERSERHAEEPKKHAMRNARSNSRPQNVSARNNRTMSLNASGARIPTT
jgi:hypothetical protein